MNPRALSLVTFAALLLANCGGGGGGAPAPGGPVAAPTATPTPQASPARALVWSDEFNGPAGAPVDPTKWTSEVGGGGWGNNEHEYYTNATDPTAPGYTTQNAFQDGNGHLVIRARQGSVAGATCWYGPCAYTSARLNTLTHFSRQYGRFEARMQIPPGQGLWPAFWMLGNSNDWPNCGEIDVMEAIGKTPSVVYGSIHGPGYVGASVSNNYVNNVPISQGFHVYAVDWQPGRVDFYFDNVLYASVTPSSLPSGATWEFDRQPFYLILNLAVGGDWPGLPDASTAFPADLVVDYVRVYQ